MTLLVSTLWSMWIAFLHHQSQWQWACNIVTWCGDLESPKVFFFADAWRVRRVVHVLRSLLYSNDKLLVVVNTRFRHCRFARSLLVADLACI